MVDIGTSMLIPMVCYDESTGQLQRGSHLRLQIVTVGFAMASMAAFSVGSLVAALSF